MKVNEKEKLIQRVLYRYRLYENHNTRLGRLLRSPLRTTVFYVVVFLAYIKPFRIYSQTLWGQKITYYLPEANQVHYYGYFEANLTNFLVRLLKQGDVFLDIGAHIGFYSLLASWLVGKEGAVYALEPTPRTYGSLALNAELADNKNIFPFQLGALDKETTIDFIDYGPKYSAFNTAKDREGSGYDFLRKQKEHVSIDTVTLDGLCAERDIRPTFIKIDAEGAEHLILKGSVRLLTEIRPLISIEVSMDEEWQENRTECFASFSNHDYQMFEITVDGYIKVMTDDVSKYDNLIAVPREKISELKELITSS